MVPLPMDEGRRERDPFLFLNLTLKFIQSSYVSFLFFLYHGFLLKGPELLKICHEWNISKNVGQSDETQKVVE